MASSFFNAILSNCLNRTYSPDYTRSPFDLKEKVVNQNGQVISLLWVSSDVHLAIVVQQWRRSASCWGGWCMQPHVQQTVMRCVLWHFSTRNGTIFLCNRAVVFHLFGRTTDPPRFVSLYRSTSPTHYCSLFGPLSIDANHCRQGST